MKKIISIFLSLIIISSLVLAINFSTETAFSPVKKTFSANPIKLTDELGNTWDENILNSDDDIYAEVQDQCDMISDWAEYEFPDLEIPENMKIESVYLKVKKFETNTDVNNFPDDRRTLYCFNGNEYIPIEDYELTETEELYISPNLRTCFSNPELTKNIKIRFNYDPFPDCVDTQYHDWAEIIVETGIVKTIDLWEHPNDLPQPVDFTTDLYFTNNTFGIGAGNDGWDWQEDTYGGELAMAQMNVDPNMNGNTGDSTIPEDNRIELRLGGGAPGASRNPNDSAYIGPMTSGAYGVQFEVTEQDFQFLQNNRQAIITFRWVADADANWGNELDAGDEAWIKARFGNTEQMHYLGSDLDSGDNDADAFNEVWWADNPEDSFGLFEENVTDYITSPGTYYLDLGGALADWDTQQEGFGAYFDDIDLYFR
ncbi:MAG: hypothetical protein ABH821_04700 [archaeon]